VAKKISGNQCNQRLKNAKQTQIYHSPFTIHQTNPLPHKDLSQFTPQKMIRKKQEQGGEIGGNRGKSGENTTKLQAMNNEL
jgi:hypothetical protein